MNNPLPKALLIVTGFAIGVCVAPVTIVGVLTAGQPSQQIQQHEPTVPSTVTSTRPDQAATTPPVTATTTTAAPTPTAAPTRTTSTALTPTTTRPRTTAPNLCGAPANPYGYNFCGGSYIYSPAGGICAYFSCIPNFWNGKGYVIQCDDGMLGKSGGRSGSCSYHGGNRRPLYQ